MDKKKNPGSNVIQFPGQKRPSPAVKQTISGHGNVGVVGDNNQINQTINISHPPARNPAPLVVQPGPQHINEAQAAEVRELVAKVVLTTGRPYSFVWGTVKRECRFSRYELIGQETYDRVCSYLRKWIARYAAGPVRDSEDQRKQYLKRIHAEAKKRPGMLDQIHAYIRGRHGTSSLADLTPGQLKEVVGQFGL